jgi:hypothetical protein
MNPDTLREFPKGLIQELRPIGMQRLSQHLDAHADAWEVAERTGRLLAGALSTYGQYAYQHPEEIYNEYATLAAGDELERNRQ